MKRIALLAAMLLVFTVAGSACKKKEQPPVPPPPAPGQGMPGAPHGPMGGATEKKVVVPDAVKAGWKSARIEVEFKEKKAKKQFTVALNSDFKIPDSDVTLKVGEFLPHFAMTADQITSNSNNLENPAVRVEVLQGGKEIFKGWLFSKFPAIHPMQHDKYGLALIEGIKK